MIPVPYIRTVPMGHCVLTAVRVLSAVLLFLLASADAQDGSRIAIVYDFVEAFDSQLASNAEHAAVNADERSGNIALPGLFVHPRGADDALVTYSDITIPDTPDPVFLLVRLGMRDGIPWDEGTANGVHFAVEIDGEAVIAETRTTSKWAARAVDLAPWKGKTVSVVFRTNAVEGNTAYDWSVWGDPIVAVMRPPAATPSEGSPGNGVLLLQLEAAQPVEVTVTVGEKRTRLAMEPGSQWVPVHFKQYEEPALQLSGGAVAERQRILAFHEPKLELVSLEPSSPLEYVGEPFNLVLSLRNTGRGTFGQREILLTEFVDAALLEPFGEKALAPAVLDVPIAPQESRVLSWGGVAVAEPGVYAVGTLASVTVTERPPELPAELPLSPEIVVLENGISIASNPWSRLVFVRGRVPATEYWIAETSDGYGWQRMGTLCPWVQVVLTDGEMLRFEVRQVGEQNGLLYITADAADSVGRAWQLRCEARPEAEAARIRMSYQLAAPEGAEIAAFYGPTVAVGDQSFGAEKDFAIFPGLEYLEGAEESSSTRDLAYPLNNRRVPAMYKITTPLMAVQGRWGLIALMWDPHQEWAAGRAYPAARFNVPAPDTGYESSTMALFVPSVGEYVRENDYLAATPYRVAVGGETLRLDCWLVLDHAANYPEDDWVVRGTHPGGMVLQSMQHYFEAFGMPAPSEPPRDVEAERALRREGYHNAVWHPEYPGWSHCVGWNPGDFVGHTIPLTVDLRMGVAEVEAAASKERIDAVLEHAIATRGPEYLWSGAGCHIALGEVPFYHGYLGEAMAAFRDHGLALIAGREDGLWRWQPQNEKYATLGTPGDHTLGQAALPSYQALRAARLSGDKTLLEQSLSAMKQMEQYHVPRGAQTWECPLYQPDILAAAQAIRAYTEAYRLTGDPVQLGQARYWAWTGLPFIYTWDLPDYPTMRYNVISVMGSTFYTHSWIGLPVVWCGLVYAYALQDLAEFDDSFDWRKVAEGITHSAMWQQYTEGPSRGAYPDSWNMVENEPRPADINPENIWLNAFRLKELSPEIRFARLEGDSVLNSSADIVAYLGVAGAGVFEVSLRGATGFESYSLLAPVPAPASATLPQVSDGAALREVPEGWHYYDPLHAVVFKTKHGEADVRVQFTWPETGK